MDMLVGTLSCTSYEVIQAPGPDLKAAVLEGLERGRIHRIDVDLGHDTAMGFARVDDPLEVDFSVDNVFFDHMAAFSFRVDKLVIPSNTRRLYYKKRLAETLAARDRPKLSKAEREEISDAVRMELLRRAIPSINAVKVVWDTISNRLRLFSTSKVVADEFTARIRDHLGLHLRLLNTVGVLERGLDERELNEAYHLLPTTFLAGNNGPDEED